MANRAKRTKFQMLPHARPGGIAGFMELLADRGGRDDLYKLADELAMDVDDLLPIVDASVMLGFAVLNEGDVEITPEGRKFGEADIQTQKQIFRDAALKNVAILRLIENTLHAKRDHAIGEEFFRDILDEHFSSDEVERQFETALNWGRYAEIFDYDSETAACSIAKKPTPLVRFWARLDGALKLATHSHSRQGTVVVAARADLVGADRLRDLRRRPFDLLRGAGSGAHLVWPIQSSRRDLARSDASCRFTRRIRCCESPSLTCSRLPSRWFTATSPPTIRAPSAS